MTTRRRAARLREAPPPGRIRHALARAGLAALALATLPATAQQAPLATGPEESRPGIPERAAPAPTPTPPGRLLPVIPVPEDDRLGSLLAEGRIDVAGFRFEGNTALDDERLGAATAAYVGDARSYADLLEARDRVTRAYVDAGYISSGARLPRQDFAEGVVVLEVVEGTLERVDVDTNGRLRKRYLASRVGRRDDALNLRDLQKDLALLQNDPRVDRVAAELVPGESAGSSLLALDVEETRPWFTSAAFDNGTPPSVGGLRGVFAAGHRNLTGFGDTLYASYGVAEGLHDVDVRWLVPVTGNDTTVEVGTRQAWSEIVEEPLADQDIESEVQAYHLTVRHPVLRELASGGAVFGSFEWKRGESFFAGQSFVFPDDPDFGRSTVTVLRAGGEWWRRFDSRGVSLRATLNLGLDALEASEAFHTGLVQAQYVEDLRAGWLPEGTRFETRLDGQWADDAVPGLEQLALGGRGSVRGYRENRIVRDVGVAGSAELRVPLPLPELGPLQAVELGVFGDAGWADNLSGPEASQDLYSVGAGLHAFVTDYAELHVEWAQALRDATLGDEDDIQDLGLHFALQLHFP